MKLILILTSKIVAFMSQKSRTHTLKRRRTQNESLFGAIIGPFSFETEQEEAVTVNDNDYQAMLNEFFSQKLKSRY